MKNEYMNEALNQAKIAYKKNEVPIGAVIVKDDKIIAKAYNKREKSHNAICHAEVLAIQKACKRIKDWRLSDCDIYVTLEPCPMCAGAIVNARLKNLYFGAYEKTSNSSLLAQIISDKRLNHTLQMQGGILEEECSKILKEYFASRRKKDDNYKK